MDLLHPTVALQAKAQAAWTSPKPEDLVLVRDIQKEKQHSRKLDPAWMGPRLLIGISSSGVSRYVQELYGEKVKRCHLDDLKTNCPRQQSSNATTIKRSAMPYAEFRGQRVVDLYSLA